ncbi:prenyltransferase [Allobranchiibius sp. GilTou38]|uniref:prenyltransferase n=1 Tax=Allobranchiibius sp. GilTou38 TaxID=2815210 RepID=UPI001AA18417|nr:prenyltransferase [Allobranchiibius sp. GilTou38]MBO1767264.1 prenyltransferase [Allobranchiibius sp. GilTou38]
MTLARLAVPGVLSAEQVARTGQFIVRQQAPDGAIPWFVGSHLDPWDHVESAMGLSVTGHHAGAVAAYDYLARTQRADGSWPMATREGRVEEAAADTNQSLYVATGVWHHYLVTGQTDVLARFWPTVERAVRFALTAMLPSGALAWAVSEAGAVQDFALVTGSASAAQSLECAVLIAERLGHDRTDWRWARDGIHSALRERADAFADRDRYSMDWYYPVLCGIVRGAAGLARLQESSGRFVWDGRGCRCVADEPWVTAAETAELIAALDALGENAAATAMFEQVQFLRDEESGGYWTGKNIPNDEVYPIEQTGWSAAAILLAADALTQTTGGAAIFRDAGSCLVRDGVADGAAS